MFVNGSRLEPSDSCGCFTFNEITLRSLKIACYTGELFTFVVTILLHGDNNQEVFIKLTLTLSSAIFQLCICSYSSENISGLLQIVTLTGVCLFSWQARKALTDRQKELEVKTQQLEIKLSNRIEEDIKKARRKSTQAGQGLGSEVK